MYSTCLSRSTCDRYFCSQVVCAVSESSNPASSAGSNVSNCWDQPCRWSSQPDAGDWGSRRRCSRRLRFQLECSSSRRHGADHRQSHHRPTFSYRCGRKRVRILLSRLIPSAFPLSLAAHWLCCTRPRYPSSSVARCCPRKHPSWPELTSRFSSRIPISLSVPHSPTRRRFALAQPTAGAGLCMQAASLC